MRPLVEVRSLEFAYPVAKRGGARAFRLSGVSFSIAPGEIVGVIGPNSAGKTTVIRLITKVLEPHAGEVRLDGTSLRDLTRWDLARRVAVVPQQMPSVSFTVEQLVLLGRYPHAPGRLFERPHDFAAVRAAMMATGVEELAAAELESLSGGERQRAILARALAQEPRLLILDEPTAHLDLRYQTELAGLLRQLNRERGVAILLVSHDLNLAAELSDRLLLLSGGRVARLGEPEEVLEPTLIEDVYGCAVWIDANTKTGRPRVQLQWGR